MTESFAFIFIGVFVAIVIFVLLREFWCWYWKINEIKNLLTTISEKLDKFTTAEPPIVSEEITASHALNEPVGMKKINLQTETKDTGQEAETIPCGNCGKPKKRGEMCPHCGSWQS